MKRSPLLLLLVFACPGPALCDEPVEHLLRYKFQPGETLRWEVDQRSSVRNTMEGTTQEAQTKTRSLKVWKVTDVLPSGEIEFLNLVERVRMENRLPDRAAMVFDSTSGEEPPPGFEDAAKAVGVPLSLMRISPRGEVLKREVKHRQPAADPHESVVLELPEEPIAVGASWSAPLEVMVKMKEGGTKAIRCRRKQTLESVKNGVAVIRTEFQVLSSTTPEIDAQLAQRLVEGRLRFDLERGRLTSQRLDVDRRVIGFAGATSSMHLRTRLEEQLVEDRQDVASRE